MRFTSYVLILGALFIAKSSMSQIKVTPAITHVSCSGSTNGSIKLTPTGTGTPYTYAWQPGSTTGNNISIKGIGAYSVTVTNASATSTVNVYNIGYKIKWQSFYPGMSTSANGDTLIHANDGSNTWLKTADGANVLPGSTDGWVEYVVTNTTYAKMFGFLDAGSGTAWNNVDFAMMLNAGGSLNSVANGTQYSIGSYTAGDVLRIERSGSTILYKKNGATISTTVIATPMVQSTLTLRAAINTSLGRFENMGCSFSIAATAPNVSAGANQTLTISSPTVVLNGSSSTSGATFLWSPGGSTVATPTVSSAGIYTLSVATASCINTATTSVIYKLSCLSTITNYQTNEAKGQISLSIGGGTAPYNIAWNGAKLPTNQEYLNDLAANGFSISPTNTVTLASQLNTLRQSTLLTDLPSAIYNNKIYDANNEAINFTTLVGTKFIWLSSGVSTTSCVIPAASPTDFKAFYGLGEQVTATTATGYAVSDCALNASEREAYVEFAINRNTDVITLGLKTANSVNNNLVTDMTDNTFLKLANQNMTVYYNNVIVYSTSCANGDAFGILLDPITQTIAYYKNGIKVFTRSQALSVISKDLQFKVLPTTNGAIIKNIIMAGATRAIRQITGTVTDVTCGSSTSGMIQFSAFSRVEQCCNYVVTGPNGYSSSGTLATLLQSNWLYGLQAGVYTITVPLYNLGTTPPCSGTPLSTPMVQNFTISYMPDWINQAPVGSTNVNINDRSFNITAAQSSPYTWLAGASSQNVLNSVDAGWAEFKPTLNSGLPIGLYSNTALSFGLNNTDLSPHPSDNDYYFYVKTYLIAYSAGIGGSGSAPLVGPYLASMSAAGSPIGTPFYTSPSDVLRVNKVSLTSGTTMRLEYYKNSALQTTSGSYTSVDLVADLSVNQKNLYINKPRISFGCKIPLQYAIVKKKLDGGYYTAFNGKLYFKYDEEYDDTDTKLNFNIYNSQNAIVYSSLTAAPVLSAINGDNRYFIDVSAATPITAGFYVLEVINEKNEKWYLRFKK